MRRTVPLVGNRASKIFHSPGDPHYGVVAPDRQVLFWSTAAATEAGYRAARNQHYGRGVLVPRAPLGQAPAAQTLTQGQDRARVHGRTMEPRADTSGTTPGVGA